VTPGMSGLLIGAIAKYQRFKALPAPAPRLALPAPGRENAANSAFEIAKAGGKHAGFLKNYLGRSPTEIEKRHRLRIPMKPAMHSNMKPATRSDLKPATVPI
jgi:hypothetical protein